MPLNREGIFTADQVYALTADLLYLNDVISKDKVLDYQNLSKIEMPNLNNSSVLPEWKREMQRLPGYPFQSCRTHHRPAVDTCFRPSSANETKRCRQLQRSSTFFLRTVREAKAGRDLAHTLPVKRIFQRKPNRFST